MADAASQLEFPIPVYLREIMENLFKFEDTHHSRVVKQMVEKNAELGGPSEGFLYGGHFISVLEGPARHAASTIKKKGHPDLDEEARSYLAIKKKRDRDYQKISQALGIMLRPCKTYQDLRDALPEVLVWCCDAVRGIPRIREEGWTLHDRPLIQVQFDEMEDDILYYLATKIVY